METYIADRKAASSSPLSCHPKQQTSVLRLKTLEILQEKVTSIAKQQIFFNLILRNSCTVLDETS